MSWDDNSSPITRTMHAIFGFNAFSGNRTQSTNFPDFGREMDRVSSWLTNGKFRCVPFPKANALHGSSNARADSSFRCIYMV